MGFTFEHVSSLAEEWNNKIAGEKAGFAETNMREGLAAIGMSIKDVIDLKPEDAFAKIMNAGRDMVKNGKFDEFASAADKIYGQEANRMLTSFAQKMHDTDRDFTAFVGNYKQFVSVTGSAQNGAVQFTNMWNKGIAMIEKQFANFFGDVGTMLGYSEGAFDEWLQSFGVGTKKIREFLLNYTVKAFTEFIKVLTETKNWVVDNQEAIIDFGKVAYSALKSLLNIGINLVKALNPLAHIIGLVALAVLKLTEGITWLMGTELGGFLTAVTLAFVTLAAAALKVQAALVLLKASAFWTQVAVAPSLIGKMVTALGFLKTALFGVTVAGAPILLWGAAFAGIALGVRAIYNEWETVKDLLMTFATGGPFGVISKLYEWFGGGTDIKMTKEQKIAYERSQERMSERDRLARLKQTGGSGGTSTSTDNSNHTKYVTNHNTISDPQTAQELTDVVLRPATM
jgi:hypothetical protein